MKQLYFLDEEEKNRILNLHESATKRHYLSEQQTGAKFIYNNPNDRAYDYKMENGKYYFKGKENTTDKKAQKYKDWYEAKADKGIRAIKALFDAGTNVTTTEVKPSTNTDPSKAAQETAKVAQTGAATGTPAAGTPAAGAPAAGAPAAGAPAAGTPAAGAPAAGAPAAGTTPGATSGVVSVNANDIIATSETETGAPVASTTSTNPQQQQSGETKMFSPNPENKVPENIGFKTSTPKIT
jgi:hypothetical protein